MSEVIQRSGADLELWTTASDLAEPTLESFTRVIAVPETAGSEDAVLALIEEVASSVDAIIPCRDDDVAMLARLKDERSEFQSKALVGDAGLATAFLDKMASSALAEKVGIPFAESHLADDAAGIRKLFSRTGFPLIVKPRKGFASRGVSVVAEESQLDAVCGDTEYVVQEFLGPGGNKTDLRLFWDKAAKAGLPLFYSFEQTKLSIQAVIGPDGAVIDVFSGAHRMSRGISAVVEAYNDVNMQSVANEWCGLLAQAGWRGPVNVQYQFDTLGRPKVFEFNGRFTGATSARTLLGFNEVGLALRAFFGLQVPELRSEYVQAVKRHVTRGVLTGNYFGTSDAL